MPLYEYRCTACGHRFEVIQKFSDAPVKKCPQCGKAVEKLLSSPAIQFKGTGWYVTDYAHKGASPDAKADGTEKADSTKESAPSSKEPPAPAATKGSGTTPATTPAQKPPKD